MTNELSKNLRCVSMRNGVEIWIEADQISKLQELLSNIRQSTFVHFGERTINTADIVGIFLADDMADLTQRKNGRWKCKEGNWHDKGENCDCVDRETIERNKRIALAMSKCQVCKGTGWIDTGNGARQCDCTKTV